MLLFINDGVGTQKMQAIVLKLFNRLMNIVERLVTTLLAKTVINLRPPAARQFFYATDIEITVVEPVLQLRHVAGKEAPILTNRVTAHGRFTRATPLA